MFRLLLETRTDGGYALQSGLTGLLSNQTDDVVSPTVQSSYSCTGLVVPLHSGDVDIDENIGEAEQQPYPNDHTQISMGLDYFTCGCHER